MKHLRKSNISIYTFIKKLNKLKPEFIFFCLASVFGLIILFLTPPFQTPDEFNHFYKAYQISEGEFISIKQDNRVGGYIPVSLVKIAEPFHRLPGNMHAKTNYKVIKELSKIPLKHEERIFVDFPNTGMYSFISYLPQAISIFILRKSNLNPIYIFYGARIFTLIVWIFFVYGAIKIIPIYKWLFTLLALLPMSLFVNMSLSADVVTNLLSFLFIALTFKLAYSEQKLTNKDLIIIGILAILIASSKLVYTPLILLVFFIPRSKFQFHKKHYYYLYIVSLCIIAFGTVLFWSSLMNHLYTPYDIYNAEFRGRATLIKDADMHKQIQYILNNGFYISEVLFNSMINTFDMYFQGYIGTFGWLDAKLSWWFIYLSYAVILFIALLDNPKEIKFSYLQKGLLVVILFLIVLLVLVTQHLIWDIVGGKIIANIQGRYFIPALPILFILVHNNRFRNHRIILPLFIIYFALSMTLTINKLYFRYYKPSEFEKTIIICSAEKTNKENAFETNLSNVKLGNANTQSQEKSRFGFSSVKLTPKNKYGFTYRLQNCKIGDIFNVEVWRYGTEGSIVIDGDKNSFYVGRDTPTEEDSLGWKKIKLKYTITQNVHNTKVSMYLFYNGVDSTYFDDIAISYYRLK